MSKAILDKWYQVWVTHSTTDVAVAIMQRCDPVIQRFTGLVCAPEGASILNDDGTIEVRAYNEHGFRYIKKYLKEQGFTIDREQENE